MEAIPWLFINAIKGPIVKYMLDCPMADIKRKRGKFAKKKKLVNCRL